VTIAKDARCKSKDYACVLSSMVQEDKRFRTHGLVENGRTCEVILHRSDFHTGDLKISRSGLHIYRHHVCHKQQYSSVQSAT
jgi:hypothetical protein